MIKLGVNVDHVATIRQARNIDSPNPVEAAFIAEKAGAHGITVHLREDKRHIQPHDVRAIKEHLSIPLNLEMALSDEVIELALDVIPHSATIVPEKREELTTEGGLDVIKNKDKIKSLITTFSEKGIITSLFIDPDPLQIEASKEVEAPFIELHTGDFCNAYYTPDRNIELEKLHQAANLATKLEIKVNAGHGLNYQNVQDILTLEGLIELNIGHSIVSRALMVGMDIAIRDMLDLLN